MSVEVVQYGTNYAPLTIAPNFTVLEENTPPAYVADLQAKVALRTAFVTDFSTIIDSTISFIDTAYSAVLFMMKTPVSRDAGLFIDAMMYDLTYGGESRNMPKQQDRYFETGSTVVAQSRS